MLFTNRPSSKMIRTIRFIESSLNISFMGDTFDEAFFFINQNIDDANYAAKDKRKRKSNRPLAFSSEKELDAYLISALGF